MDILLHYTEAADGFPLILLHGNGEGSDYFKNQIPEFSKYFRSRAAYEPSRSRLGDGKSGKAARSGTRRTLVQILPRNHLRVPKINDFRNPFCCSKLHRKESSDAGLQ